MDGSTQRPVASTLYGSFVGRRNQNLDVFRGVPYAQSPVGPLRFKDPVPLAPSDETYDAVADGPIPPQLPARLSIAMGPIDAAQGEECLNLTIWSPSIAAGPFPVLVWFPGGAFVTGAGSLPWYSGARLAEEGGLVVVGVTSRLGALGYARIKGVNSGNMGLRDQLASLQWVQQCISAFGGDPSNVTIAGQSAGGYAVLALAAMPDAETLFRRAIVQSAPLGTPPESQEEAENRGDMFVHAIGGRDQGHLEQVSLEAILRATSIVLKGAPRSADGFTGPYSPSFDERLLPRSPLDAARAGKTAWCKLILGYTRDESTVFFGEKFGSVPHRESVQTLARRLLAEFADRRLSEYEMMSGPRMPSELLADLMTDVRFVMPTLAAANAHQRHGGVSYCYQFNWSSRFGDFGACHCIELPFLFGNRGAWQKSSMIDGVTEPEFDHIGSTLRKYWSTFVRQGSTDADGLLTWPRYDDQRRMMVFDRRIREEIDPAGLRWSGALQHLAGM